MHSRLCGREQEFGIRVSPTPKLPKRLPGERDYYFRSFSEAILAQIGRKYEALGVTELQDCEIGDEFFATNDDFWLANGVRMYVDQGILETATPEHRPCTLDSIIYEKATELMLNEAIAAFLQKNSRYKSVSLYKNNISYDFEDKEMRENTYGSHQNYSCPKKSVRKISGILRSFLPAALPLTGNGHILYLNPGVRYCFSQRANHIRFVINGSTIDDRPLINTKGFDGEDTLMADNKLARVHLISCDATRCEFQTWLVEGILHLVLRLAEEGWDLPKGLRLVDPVRNLQDFNLTLDPNCSFMMQSGRRMKSSDYLRVFLKGARQLKPLSEGEKKCLQEWETVMELLEDPSRKGLVGKLDWATKLYLLENQMKKHGFDLDSGRALAINMEYHNISRDPRISWFARLQELGYLERFCDDKQIERAIRYAPETRAAARGKFIRRCLQTPGWRRKIGGMTWGGAFWEKAYVTFGRNGNPLSTELDEFKSP